MCGRFVSKAEADLERFFNVRPSQFKLFESYNVCPRMNIPVVRLKDADRELVFLRWGLIPFCAEDTKIGDRLINARAETVRTKPAFRAAFKWRRCLIPVSGFYEWQRSVNPSLPHYVCRRDGAPMTFAGLWESWTNKQSGEVIESCAIITCEANSFVAPVHHRQPVILEPETFDVWLSGSTDEAEGLLRPGAVDLEVYPIARRVNSPRHNDAGLIEPLWAA